MAANPKHTIHEITRNLTKQHEPMLTLDDLSVAARKFGGKIVKICAPGIGRDVCGRFLRSARGQKKGER